MNLRDSVPRYSKLSSRINIMVSVPALNYSFPVNQPENGNSRLIIVLINSKVSNLLTQDQQISAVTFNGEVLDTSKTYKELGIRDTSVVSVIISSGNKQAAVGMQQANGFEYGRYCHSCVRVSPGEADRNV